MELNQLTKQRFKVAPLLVSCIDDEGKIIEKVLNIKYRPLSREWMASVDEVQQKLNQIQEEGLGHIAKLAELENKLSEKTKLLKDAGNDKKQQLEAEIKEHVAEVEKQKALLESFLEESKEIAKNAATQRLLPVLIDLDLTDNGVPIKPTPEILLSLDDDFLLDVLDAISKKMSRGKTT